MSPARTTGAAGASLAPGARLGPYTIEAALGAGGMGEVWRARDTRLGRSVALKVLPARFAQSAARLARLEREARLLASLNHPHIATLYGLEESGGTPALVMELVEGATLAARLHRGALPPGEALEIGRQIAEALEAAHDKGILHRDLKPANVRLTEKGQVKLLDFGLAQVLQPVADEPPLSPPSTLSTEESPVSPGTGVAGTAPYMSPEQARGEDLDRRSDVWAFGCVLYEMLTGRRAFGGGNFAEAVAAVLGREPEWTALPLETPAAVRTLLERCLRKDRGARLRDAGDARLELEELLRRARGRGRWEVEERPPYPGLRAFDEKDAGVFFGREREVGELWGKLRERRLLAVIGPSGAGKTSFLRAGVIPARPEGWGAVCATPGASPALGLVRALTGELAGDPEAIGELLSGVAELDKSGETRPLVSVARQWRTRHVEALLVVDQLEELFTLNPPATQAPFATLLGRLATEADVHVVLSLRDDFLMRCHEQRALTPVFSQITPLGPLRKEELRCAIVEPASKRGYRFEDEGLVDAMMGAVEGARATLPLVAFAVSRLWEKRDRERKLLTREAYREIAGVEGALAQHAEAAMDSIGSERQATVREIFRILVTAQGTRAVIDREELLSAFPDGSAADDVLRQLIDARLLTTYEVEGKEDGRSHHRVEVVHESLLRVWPRLVRWQTQDADGAQLRDQLRQAAHLWYERGRTPDLLWTGAAERELELWRERYPGRLSAVEEGFARAMVDRARRRKRLRRLVAVSVVAAALAVACLTGVLWWRGETARSMAEAEVRQREAAQILSLGRLRLDSHPTAALAHALASLERSDNEPARRFAVEALWRGPMVRVVTDPINPGLPEWSPDGQWLAVGGGGGLLLFGRDTGERRQLESKWASPVGFSTDGSRLVTRVLPDALHLWALPGLQQLSTWTLPRGWAALFDRRLLSFERDDPEQAGGLGLLRERSIDGGPERVLGHSPIGEPDGRGRWLFSIEDGRLVRRRLDALEASPIVLGRHEGDVDVWMLPWSDRLVTADARGEIRIWHADSGRLERTLRSPADARYVALDPSGRYLAAAPGGAGASSLPSGSFRVFDLEAPADADSLALLDDEISYLNRMSFHPGGNWLASGNYPYGLLLWNLAGRRSLVLRGQKAGLTTVAFASDGRLLSTSDEGVVRLWPLWTDPKARVREVRSQAGQKRLGGWLDVSRDGRFAVVGHRLTPKRVIVVPLDGSPGAEHEVSGEIAEIDLAPDGRRVAVSYTVNGRPEKTGLQVLDLETGGRRALRVRDTTDACVVNAPDRGPVQICLWLPDGRLVSDGALGLRLWNLADGSSRQLRACRDSKAFPPYLAATPDSNTVLTLFDPWPRPGDTSMLMAFDLATGVSHEIGDHGGRLSAMALDPTGTILVTGDIDGLVRVGRLAGGEPHLLYGHSQAVTSIAISRDGRWIASASDDETIRLWPMPDTTRPPLHTLPHDELLAKLRSFTNLRVAVDPETATGYKLEAGAFPGWKDVPTW